jgi:uncharacterized membrane protein YkvA (DUF1232 family)
LKASLKQIAQHVKTELAVYRLALYHPQTPRLAKILLWLAIGYLLLPFDLIPDFIPVLGQLDDLIIVPGLIYLALRRIPDKIMDECREQTRMGNLANE